MISLPIVEAAKNSWICNNHQEGDINLTAIGHVNFFL
jgi:hypothetical protein